MAGDDHDTTLARLRGQAVKKLGRVLECIRLLDLNRSDAEFRGRVDGPAQRGWAADGRPLAASQSSGEILYVVDTNFIQAFLQPLVWLGTSRLFHDPSVWPASTREGEWAEARGGKLNERYQRLCDRVSAQATMLATELVLREAFKSSSGKIYMSLDHQAELIDQVRKLKAKYESLSRGKPAETSNDDGSGGEPESVLGGPERTPKDQRDYILRTRSSIIALGKLRQESRDIVEAEMKNDRLFIPDSIKVSSLSNRDFEALKRNYINARLCRILAEDDLIEPGMQMKRLQSDEFWERMGVIEWCFPKPTDKELQDLEKQKGLWHERLTDRLAALKREDKDERSKPKENHKAFLGRVVVRTEKSVRADANTLAYLIWAAKRAGPNRRIVFVTGSGLLIDAYREWYAKEATGMSFLLRPLAQYAPQYNLQDADAVFARELQLFEQTRQVLEASTYPMTHALRRHYLPPEEQFSRLSGARARDRFCVEAAANAVSPDLVDELIPMAGNIPSVRNSIQHMDGMADALRWLERLAIGAVPDLVRSRAEAAEKAASDLVHALEAVGGEASDAQGVIEKWLQTQLDSALTEGFSFSLSVAVQNILEQINAGHYQTPSRAKIGLRLKFPLRGQAVSAADWLSALGKSADDEREDTLRKLTEQPVLVFALAAWLTFRSQLWSDAVRFADFACRASELALVKGELVPAYHECLYLKAVSLGVRMMADAPDPTRHDADLWRRDLHGAEVALQACIEAHESLDERLLAARAYSERAAVRFSYCAWAAFGQLSGLETYRDERLVMEDIFRGGVEDLLVVVQALPALRTEYGALPIDDPDRATLSWIDLQARVNPECARLVYEQLTTRVDPFREEYHLRGSPKLKAALDGITWPNDAPNGEENNVMQAYALSAQLRMGLPVSRAKIVSVLGEARQGASLALDRAMLRVIETSLSSAHA